MLFNTKVIKYFSIIMSNGLRAILLSAGLGTRLRPLTNKKPKCLMEINNVPILKIWIEKLEQIGCSEILINTHYLSEQVTQFIDNYSSKSLKILISHEKTLLTDKSLEKIIGAYS